jgi:hypothetical protein
VVLEEVEERGRRIVKVFRQRTWSAIMVICSMEDTPIKMKVYFSRSHQQKYRKHEDVNNLAVNFNERLRERGHLYLAKEHCTHSKSRNKKILPPVAFITSTRTIHPPINIPASNCNAVFLCSIAIHREKGIIRSKVVKP